MQRDSVLRGQEVRLREATWSSSAGTHVQKPGGTIVGNCIDGPFALQPRLTV